jgi:hypothetical protein
MTDDDQEPWETWNGSYQQAYLRGRADAAGHPPCEVDGDPMPGVTLADAWHVLTGYLIADDKPVNPQDVLALMREQRAEAYAPVHAWWKRHFGKVDSPWESAPSTPNKEQQ